jgi:hypothetical protein
MYVRKSRAILRDCRGFFCCPGLGFARFFSIISNDEEIMMNTAINALRLFVCAVFMVQLMGCGTIMYPERKGQSEGRIDAGVAILDGLGLLFFIIPGVIAFAVDFSNGTIYLPERHLRSSLDDKTLKVVTFDAKHSSMASIERIIKDESGCVVKLEQGNIKISKLKSVKDMMVQFAKILPVMQNERIALL